jgi:ComF family protein
LSCKTPNQSGAFCAKCQPHYSLDGILIAGNYDDKLLNQLIKTLKYHFVKDVATVLGNYLTSFLQSETNHKSKIINHKLIAVPLHSRRWRWRGFNQAEAIAKIVSQNFQLEINIKDLIRINHRQAQSKLNEQQRLGNVTDCFSWRGQNLAGADIILVDDVVTPIIPQYSYNTY